MSVDRATEAWLNEGKISSLPANESEMSETLTLVLLKYIGLPVTGPVGRTLRRALRLPARRFSRLAVEVDSIVARDGYRAASRWIVSRFLPALEVRGHEHIRESGPVLLVANHPGTIDSFAVAANLPRDDFKAIARGYPFFRALPSISQHLIFSELDTHVRMATARKAIRHLREGGILLVFPSSGMDPDPSCLPGADAVLDTWSASPDVLVRAVPEAQVHVVGMSGFLERRNASNPLARLPKGQYEKQIVAETFQMIGHLVFNRQIPHGPRVLFSPPYDVSALADGSGCILPRLIQIAHETLARVSPPTVPVI